MNIQSLRYVVQISKIGSINKAAQHLYVSQPTLSRAIHEIEESTGIILFTRTNKGVVPTCDGEVFLAKAAHLLEDFDNLQGEYFYQKVSKEHEAQFKVATAGSTPAFAAMIECYQRYWEKNGYQDLVFEEGTRDEVLQMVAGEIYHIGVIHYRTSQENSILAKCDENGLCCHVLDRSATCAQFRKGHPLEGRETVSLEDLAPYPHVVYNGEDVAGINFCSDVRQYNRNTLKKRIILRGRGDLRHVIEQTDGYYLGCDMKYQFPPSVNPNVCSVPLRDTKELIHTVCLYKKNYRFSEEERQFLHVLKEIYQRELAGQSDI